MCLISVYTFFQDKLEKSEAELKKVEAELKKMRKMLEEREDVKEDEEVGKVKTKVTWMCYIFYPF